jgi:pimeloyl-ACP methyl ester carboxylesterase
MHRAKHRGFLSRPSLHVVITCAAVFLAGCGSTITTRIQSWPALPVPAGMLSRAQINRNVSAIKRESGLRIKPGKSHTAVLQLVLRAQANPQRLAQAAQVTLQQAQALPASRGEERGAFALAACEIAYQSLRESGLPASSWLTSEETRKPLAIYNTALAMFVFEYSKKLAGGTAPLSVRTPLGPRIVAARYASDSRYAAGYFEELIPSDYVRLTGFRKRTRVDGLGVPLVGVRKRTEARKAELRFQPPNRDVVVALGCFAKFESRREASRMDITLFDLDRTATVPIGSDSIPLAADFTVPLALASGGMNDLKLGIRAILNAGASADVKGIYLIDRFDPNRIPVLLLHGLMSSPLVWRNVATAAMKDPIIRRNYQFWYAFYSTGVPVAQSAALIRDRIAFIRRLGDPGGKSRASKNMVIIGYSMGGIIARILATDMGDHFWTAVSSKPFDQVKLEPEDRKELQHLIFWKPVPGVKEVIFLATPHRGTRMADASFAQLGRRLVGLPASLLRFQHRVLSAVVDVLDGVKVTRRSITGIDSLSPEAPIYRAFGRAPFAPGLVYHSVIGDRGRGDSPESSDGVVGYWSSHLESAKSELIVPTGHDVQTHPKTVAEIQRILLRSLSKRAHAP